MPEPATATFISASWIKPLWKKLLKIRGDRKKEIDAMGNDFGDPITLARYYVEPHCQHHNPADYDEREPISFVRSPAFETINRFLRGDFVIQGDGRSQMFVLSDAGMGKTSLLLMLKLSHLMSFWPRGYKCVLLKSSPSSIEAIADIKDRANTVLLLDALDEDSAAWQRIAERLQELLSETVTFRRVLISCRTQFFPEDAGDPFGLPGRVKVAGFVCPLLYLSLFDDAQVESYLRKRFPKRWFTLFIPGKSKKAKRSRAIIDKMDSLRFRPLLLAHIDYIVDADAKVWNEYTVYSALVESWLMREQRKRFSQTQLQLASERLLTACTKVAEHMNSTGERAISLQDIKQLVSSDDDVKQLDHIDIGGRSLLNRRSDGAYRFSHYTIQEFLIVHAAIRDRLNLELTRLRMTDQMLRFLLFACCSKLEISDAHIRQLSTLITDADLRGLDLSDLVCPHVSLQGAKLTGSNLSRAILRNADLTGANLSRANLQRTDFSRANLTNCDLREANCQGAVFVDAQLNEADLRGGIFRQAIFTGAQLSEAKINPEDLIGVVGLAGSEPVASRWMATMHNFTPRAQQTLALARKEADRFNHNYVGSDHLLLAIIRLQQGVAFNVLRKHGVDIEALRRAIASEMMDSASENVVGNIPYTPEIKKALALAGRQAKQLNHSYVGTEHLLLGLLLEGSSRSARYFFSHGVTVEQIREGVLKELDPSFELTELASGPPKTADREIMLRRELPPR